MADQPAASPPPTLPGGSRPDRRIARHFGEFFNLRGEAPLWQRVLLGLTCVAVCVGVWWYVTRGEREERIVPYYTLPSPGETLRSLPELWKQPPDGRDLPLHTYVTLRRLVLGFGLAALVGVPLGVLCGCFPGVNAFFTPLTIFGRNIPVAALIGLLILIFDVGEKQKVMFIFFASVAFVVSDTARAVMDVGNQYVDTAYTLGAGNYQIVLKVLVPLAMPSVFNSLRLLFGLAFGYIMLAEMVGAKAGLGFLINTSLRRGPREHIYLILMIIPALALAIDRLLFWMQQELFPYRYGGPGLLHRGIRALLHGWEDLKGLVRRPPATVDLAIPQGGTPGRKEP
jgi:NitT/TauT family transport system permease protein